MLKSQLAASLAHIKLMKKLVCRPATLFQVTRKSQIKSQCHIKIKSCDGFKYFAQICNRMPNHFFKSQMIFSKSFSKLTFSESVHDIAP